MSLMLAFFTVMLILAIGIKMKGYSAFPEHLNTREEVEAAFPDDEQFGTKSWWGRLYRWYNKETKPWFAFSYRSKFLGMSCRKYPKLLLALGGDGPWRFEGERGENYDEVNPQPLGGEYLSRIQYYKRWHVAVQWPLTITAHVYPKAFDVPKLGEPRPDSDGKLWFAYWGHFDADFIHWLITSGYLGRNWK